MPVGRQLGAAVLRNLAFDQQVAGFPRGAVLSAKIAVLDDAGKLPGVALGVPFRGAGELREPIAVEALPCNRNPCQQHQGATHQQPDRFSHFYVLQGKTI